MPRCASGRTLLKMYAADNLAEDLRALDAKTAELAAGAAPSRRRPTAADVQQRARPTATRRGPAAAVATRTELEAMAKRVAVVEGQLAEATAREAAMRTRLEKVEQELVVTRKARAGRKFWSCASMFGSRSAKVDQDKDAAP